MDVSCECRCGKVRGKAIDVPKRVGARVVCYCDDCQAYARFLKRAADVLDANGGTDIVQMPPSQLQITKGQEYLQSMRLSPKGMIRWYTSCCNTPVANTANIKRLPFAGVVHAFLDPSSDGVSRDQAFGPIDARCMSRFAIGNPPEDSYPTVPLRLMMKLVPFLLGGLVRQAHQPSPFPEGIVPLVLNETQRTALDALS